MVKQRDGWFASQLSDQILEAARHNGGALGADMGRLRQRSNSGNAGSLSPSKLKEEDHFSNTAYFSLHTHFIEVYGNGKNQRAEILPVESP